MEALVSNLKIMCFCTSLALFFLQFERQQAKEEAFQLTQDLDADWKMIQSLLHKRVTVIFLLSFGTILLH